MASITLMTWTQPSLDPMSFMVRIQMFLVNPDNNCQGEHGEFDRMLQGPPRPGMLPPQEKDKHLHALLGDFIHSSQAGQVRTPISIHPILFDSIFDASQVLPITRVLPRCVCLNLV